MPTWSLAPSRAWSVRWIGPPGGGERWNRRPPVARPSHDSQVPLDLARIFRAERLDVSAGRRVPERSANAYVEVTQAAKDIVGDLSHGEVAISQYDALARRCGEFGYSGVEGRTKSRLCFWRQQVMWIGHPEIVSRLVAAES